MGHARWIWRQEAIAPLPHSLLKSSALNTIAPGHDTTFGQFSAASDLSTEIIALACVVATGRMRRIGGTPPPPAARRD